MPTNKNLGILAAAFHALCGKEIDYYPRIDGKTISPDDYLKDITSELKNLDALGEIDDSYLDRAKDSLTEVKALTEYQDQKAARLLTIVAFLTAAAGALFSKLLDTYPLHQVFLSSPAQGLLLGAVYSLFGLFLLCVAFGALIIFHATQTKFVWPKDKSEEATYDFAISHLFYRSILRTKPVGWAKSFVNNTAIKGASNALTARYYKNYVSEAYLVAAKLGDKLRYLQPGQKLLLLSIKVLMAWLLLLFVAALWIPGAKDSSESQALNAPISCSWLNPFGTLHSCTPATDVHAFGDTQVQANAPAQPAPAQVISPASDTVGPIKQSVRGSVHDHASCSMRRGQHSVGH